MFNNFWKNRVDKTDSILDADCPYKVERPQKYTFDFPQEDIDNANMELDSGLQKEIDNYILEIRNQREEILKAFVAKYGFQPDEAEQVEEINDNGFTWYVRKREVND